MKGLPPGLERLPKEQIVDMMRTAHEENYRRQAERTGQLARFAIASLDAGDIAAARTYIARLLPP
jgi:hypothetical protein